MILVDYSQTVISTIFAQLNGTPTKRDIDPSMIRHMLLNVLRSLRLRFPKSTYGEIIICYDSGPSWRKEFFPYYKAARHKEMAKSDIDWSELNNIIAYLRGELHDHFPYKVIGAPAAEADDVIAAICHMKGIDFGEAEPIIIISRDRDFFQLHKYSNVRQWDNINKKWLTIPDPEECRVEHIIRGDTGDGVPNILSDDACLATGVRQTVMTKKRLAEAIEWTKGGSFPSEEHQRRYLRNKMLIDLDMIPPLITESVRNQFEAEKPVPPGLFKYMNEKRLKLLVEFIGDFR